MAALGTTLHLSGASNSDPNLSLGGVISVEVSGTPLNNIYDNVTALEANDGLTDYRCLYVKNPTASIIENVAVLIQSRTPPSSLILEFGVDPSGPGNGTSTGVATTIPDELTPPSGVTFGVHTDLTSRLVLGNLAAGDCRAFWIKRIVAPLTSPRPSFDFTLRMVGKQVV